MKLKIELERIVRCLDRADIDYGLCGGLAVAVHDYPRATQDIDILIEERDLNRARKALAAIEYDLEAGVFKFKQATEQETRLFRVSRAEGSEMTTLDLMLVTPVLRDIWASREIVESDGCKIKVVTRDALIRMKELAGRHQDLADVDALRKIPPTPEL